MKFAVISDVHSNLEALEAVLEDIEKENVTDIYFLGDIVGYGANPLEVIEISENFKVNLLGNHDEAVFNSNLLFFFNPAARDALEWTKKVLLEAGKNDYIKELKQYPFHITKGHLLFSHGDYNKNQVYLEFQEDTAETFDYMEKENIKICFVGHTHHQGCFSSGGTCCYNILKDVYLDDYKGKKLIVNPGGVGQPRDGNPKAAYAIYTGEKIQFRRVSYDIEKAAGKIRAERGLPNSLASRLFLGQ